MRKAAIVSAARTPIGKAFRGAFNQTHGATLAGHAVAAAVQRAGVDREEIADVVMGCGLPEGATGNNLGRVAALRAGLSDRIAGTTINRYCASGLQAIAVAAGRIIVDGEDVVVAGGAESISMVQNDMNVRFFTEEWMLRYQPDVYMPMIRTAEIVAQKYGVSRERQDAYALQSQQRTASAQARGAFDDEIVPLPAWKYVEDRQTGKVREDFVTLSADEGNRPDTTLDALSKLKGVLDENSPITAGNSSQLSDGAGALVLMEANRARERSIPPLGYYRGMTVVGNAPGEMGIAPVYAIPKLLERHGLRIDDIGLWELNEAFAVQTVYVRDTLGIPNDRFNVDGGAIAVGHPYGLSGARMAMHALIEGRKRAVKLVVVAMCVAGGMGAAALFEIA